MGAKNFIKTALIVFHVVRLGLYVNNNKNNNTHTCICKFFIFTITKLTKPGEPKLLVENTIFPKISFVWILLANSLIHFQKQMENLTYKKRLLPDFYLNISVKHEHCGFSNIKEPGYTPKCKLVQYFIERNCTHCCYKPQKWGISRWWMQNSTYPFTFIYCNKYIIHIVGWVHYFIHDTYDDFS